MNTLHKGGIGMLVNYCAIFLKPVVRKERFLSVVQYTRWKSLTMATSKDGDSGEESSHTKFSITHKRGDLFSCGECESLAHCVSKDLRMGKGIATLFKQKFQGLSELKLQAKDVGEVAVLKRQKRFVYYLITKPQYFNKPTYSTLQQSLEAMKTHCVDNNVTALSMPKIGCGLDKLQWPQVEEILEKVFGDTEIGITIYSI